jgi:hypothetical protein
MTNCLKNQGCYMQTPVQNARLNPVAFLNQRHPKRAHTPPPSASLHDRRHAVALALAVTIVVVGHEAPALTTNPELLHRRQRHERPGSLPPLGRVGLGPPSI